MAQGVMSGIIAVHSMKGGVGKSSLAVNLAYAAAARARVLLWDIDAQGAASFLLDTSASGDQRAANQPSGTPHGARAIFSRDVAAAALIIATAYDGLDLIAADLSLRQLDVALDADKPKRLKKLLAALVADYDYIVLDCPPGLGALSDQIFRAVDVVVVPVPPTPLALRTLAQTEGHLAHDHGGKPPVLLPVFSMADRRKTLHRATLAAHPDWPVIPQASIVEQMAVRQRPLASFAPTSPAAQAVAGIWRRIEARLAGQPG